MKKNIKLVLALVLSIMMVLGSVALAAPDQQVDGTTNKQEGSITVKPSATVPLANKTLKAYRILDASYSATGTLGGDPAQAVAYTIPAAMADFYNNYFAQKADTTATPPVEAKTVAELAAADKKTVDNYVVSRIAALDAAGLKNFEYQAIAAAKTAGLTAITGTYNETTKNVVFSELLAGYYVIEDEGAATPISALMLDTVTNANVEITLKAQDNTEKVILTAGELLNEKADQIGLGRKVDFKVTQKIPDPTGYDYYYYMINDTLSTGLTFNPDSVIVKVGGTVLTEGTDYYLYYVGDTHHTTTAILGNKTFIVAFKDIVADIANTAKTNFVVDAAVEITYNATLNSDAVNGVDPNTNSVNVEYSNNPDKDGKGDYDEDHPGIPKNDEDHPTGHGPDKWTDTYTTAIRILKVDGTNSDAALPGVEFTLTGTAKDANFKEWTTFEIDPTGDHWLLNNGTYTTTAPTNGPTLQPTTGSAGWVEMTSGETTTDPVRVVDGKNYRPYKESTDSAKTRYVIVEGNAADYASTTIKYKETTHTEAAAAESYTVTRTGLTGSDGKLSFEELGAGTYKLAETGVLPGYNDIPDIEFTLTCTLPEDKEEGNLKNFTGKEKATWAITCNTPGYDVSFEEEKDGDQNNMGTFKITLQNNKGAELPSTGGIGTTIFYVAGSILVLAAAILLITKRRMSTND